MTKQEFMKFVEMYHDKYGVGSMGQETMRSWFGRVGHLSWEEFIAVAEKLLGEKSFKFGHGDVLKLHAVRFPKANETLELGREDYAKDSDKRNDLRKFLETINAKKDKDWIKKMAKQWVARFGEAECRKICDNLQGDSMPSVAPFIKEVRGLCG